MRSEVLTAVLLNIQAFWNGMLCSFVNGLLGLFDPEEESTMILQHTINYLTTDKA
jgi:hypothetical protein